MRNEIIELLPRLRRFALGIAGDSVDADDLVQAACERAILRAHQWQPGTRLDSWMFRIIQNIRYDQIRSRNRRQAGLNNSGQVTLAYVDGEKAAHDRLTLKSVRRAISTLPEEQKTAIMLVCVEGNSYKETAEILGVPIGTVTSRLVRGRTALARLLAGQPTSSAKGEPAASWAGER